MRSALVLAALALAGCNIKVGEDPQQDQVDVVSEPSPASTPTAAQVPEPAFQALGTEPFWSVYVEPGRLRYVTPENQEGTHFPAKHSVEGEAQVWTGTFEGGPFTLRIAPGTCSDGMSDTVYAYSALVAFKGETLQGCARLK